jgi:Na+-transporting NADH:ubiquinone oxidoreductase subunit NqrB
VIDRLGDMLAVVIEGSVIGAYLFQILIAAFLIRSPEEAPELHSRRGVWTLLATGFLVGFSLVHLFVVATRT